VRRIGRPYAVCLHDLPSPRRREIDRALLAGVSLRDIAPTVYREKGCAAPPPHGCIGSERVMTPDMARGIEGRGGRT
jgi:hypothetical protein